MRYTTPLLGFAAILAICSTSRAESVDELKAKINDQTKMYNAVVRSFKEDVLKYHEQAVGEYYDFFYNDAVTAAHFLQRGLEFEMAKFEADFAQLEVLKNKPAQLETEASGVKLYNNATVVQIELEFRMERIEALLKQLQEMRAMVPNSCSDTYTQFPKTYFDPRPRFATLWDISIGAQPKSFRDSFIVSMDPAKSGFFGAANEWSNPIGKLSDWTLSELEDATGLDLNAIRIVTDPEKLIGSTLDVVARYAKDKLEAQWDSITKLMQGDISQLINDPIGIRELSLAVDLIAQSEITAVPFELLPKSWFNFALDSYMKNPFDNFVCPNLHSVPTFYLNGYNNTFTKASEAGKMLADHLGKNYHESYDRAPTDSENNELYLLHNDSVGVLGAPNNLRDRLFAYTYFLQPIMGNAELSESQTYLTWILYHCMDRPINVICHSQGCLQSINAILVLQSLKKGPKLRSNLALVMAGSPVNDAEVGRGTAKKITSLRNHSDGVSRYIGLEVKDNLKAPPDFPGDHDFKHLYIPRIDKKMIWPSSLTDTDAEKDRMRTKANNIAEYGIYQTSYLIAKFGSFSPEVASFAASAVTTAATFPMGIARSIENADKFNELAALVHDTVDQMKKRMPTQEVASVQVEGICKDSRDARNKSWTELESIVTSDSDLVKQRRAELDSVRNQGQAVIAELMSFYDKQLDQIEVLKKTMNDRDVAILPEQAKAWFERAPDVNDHLQLARKAYQDSKGSNDDFKVLETQLNFENEKRNAQAMIAFKTAMKSGAHHQDVSPETGLEHTYDRILKNESELNLENRGVR